MTNEHLKNRAQQIIDAIPVLREKEYGWAEIEKMLNEILIELDDSPWHTGIPTEEGWYLVTSGGNNSAAYDIGKWDGESFCYMEYLDSADVVAWQKIEPYKEKNNG